ncbi:MAG: GDP-L-fucose synthase [Elusimicrobia bacterium]|nr:GDP-L-fucose synthase [Elusimicrobiota bacterium]
MNKTDKIYVAGHKGLIGSAILRRLQKDGYKNIITKEHSELDLCNQSRVNAFFEKEKPDYVFMAAGKVGGVFANNTYRADFIYENLMVQNNIIHSSFLNEVKKLLFLGSADVYPKNYQKSAKEEFLLTGPLEPTCEPFALAKIAGIKMCESYSRQYGTDFISVIAPNVYGTHQHYDMLNAQVIPSLIKKFHEAKISKSKKVILWGSGKPVRDFLFVDDFVDACIFLMQEYSGTDFFNVGTGREYTILELAETIKKAVGYKGKIVFDKTKPDGVARKLLNTSKIQGLGWKAKTSLLDGIKIAYNSFLNELENREVRTSKICNIEVCKKDTNALNKIKKLHKTITTQTQPISYKDKVVIKPWGHEFLVFKNSEVAVWLLYLKKGNATSMHCHPGKKTSLIILSGKAMSKTFSATNYLKGGDAVIIEKCVFHFTKALSDDGLFLFEIETPPMKTDLVRLEDKYGRESSGYEGLSEMQVPDKILKKGDYCYFEETNKRFTYNYEMLGKYECSFDIFMDNSEFQRDFKIIKNSLYTMCRGSLLDEKGKIVLATGDTRKSDTLENIKKLKIKEKTVLLRTSTKDKL